MPNQNTIERLVGANSPAQGSLAVPSLSLTSSTETVFTNQLGNAAVLNPPGGQIIGATTAPSFGSGLDGFAFKVRVAGKVTTTNSTNITVKIYQGTSATVGNDTQIATTGAVAVNTASSNFVLECTCTWDGVSNKLNGSFTGQIANTLVSLAALSNSATVTSMSGLQFVASATSSGAGSSNATTVTLTELAMEVV